MIRDDTPTPGRRLPAPFERLLLSGEARGVYARVRAKRIIISGYDITRRCNLRCEGCHYFEGPHPDGKGEQSATAEWRAFFREERDRGVTFPHLAGAEPALVPDRLAAAADAFGQGLVYTNGSIPVDAGLPFMLHISLWGDSATDARFRGAGVMERALSTFGADPRAVFMYTIHHFNIDEIPSVVRRVHERGGRISFNHFSPTRQYLDRLAMGAESSGRTFSRSSAGENLLLSPADLARTREIVGEQMNRFPGTVVYSRYYNEVVNTTGSLFDLDPETGVARDCPILNKPYHRQYRADLSWDDSECCVPRVACAQCRVYASVYTLIMDRMKEHMESADLFLRWLDVMDTWLALHVRGYARTDLLARQPGGTGAAHRARGQVVIP